MKKNHFNPLARVGLGSNQSNPVYRSDFDAL